MYTQASYHAIESVMVTRALDLNMDEHLYHVLRKISLLPCSFDVMMNIQLSLSSCS